jgi:hypothetical protein
VKLKTLLLKVEDDFFLGKQKIDSKSYESLSIVSITLTSEANVDNSMNDATKKSMLF